MLSIADVSRPLFDDQDAHPGRRRVVVHLLWCRSALTLRLWHAHVTAGLLGPSSAFAPRSGVRPSLEVGRVVLLLVSLTGLILEILALRGVSNFGGPDGSYPLWLTIGAVVPILLVSLSVLKWPNPRPPDPPPGP